MIQILQNGLLRPYLTQALSADFTVRLLPPEMSAQRDFLDQHAREFKAIVTSAPVGASEELIDALPNLKVICSAGVGYERIAVDRAREKGIVVSNTPSASTGCVADHAWGLIIDVMRRVSAADRFVRSGRWARGERYALSSRVHGKRLGIIGLGRIGQAIASRSIGFDMQVAYHNRSRIDGVLYDYHATPTSLARWADILVVAAAGGLGSRHLIDQAVLEALGPDSYIVNIARGDIVDEAALVAALQAGTIAGAGLDVFKSEPNVSAHLLELDNVVLQPHVASATRETFRAVDEMVHQNVHLFFATGRVATPI